MIKNKIKKEKVSINTLIKENAKLELRITHVSNEDYRIRKEISDVLGNVKQRDFGYRNDDVKVMSWEAIIFRLGVLTSQADIKKMFDENEKLGHQNTGLQILLNQEREKNNPEQK